MFSAHPPTPATPGATSRSGTCSRHNPAPNLLWGLLGSVPRPGPAPQPQLGRGLGFGSLGPGSAWGKGDTGPGSPPDLCRSPWLCCPLLPSSHPHPGEEGETRPTQRLPLGAHQQANTRLEALRRDAKSLKISKSTPPPPHRPTFGRWGDTLYLYSTALYSSKVSFWCKNIKCIMYDLVSHLIYLDNFSEEKTNKTSLGGRHTFPSPHPQFSSYFQCLPGSPLQGTRWSPTPTPGARLWGEACVQFVRCTRPTQGCQID